MNYFDLHCDTILEMFLQKQNFLENSLHVSKTKTAFANRYIQVFAVWSDPSLSCDECYRRFFEVTDNAVADSDFPSVIHSPSELSSGGAILGAEGASLLSGDISRLPVLYRKGLRVLTLCWEGVNCVGGAYDTDTGLTDFGKETVELCQAIGIAVDLSHANEKTANGVLDVMSSAPISSHVMSRALCDVPRNHCDKLLKAIAERGGVIGADLVGSHINPGYDAEGADVDGFSKHVLHLLRLCGTEGVCIGADFDGTEKLPSEIRGASDVPKLYWNLKKHGVTEAVLDKIFFDNAYRYFAENMR